MQKKVIMIDENNVDSLVNLISAVEKGDDAKADSILKDLAETSAIKDEDIDGCLGNCDECHADDCDLNDEDDDDCAEEMFFLSGMQEGFAIAKEIYEMPVTQRKELFGTMKFTDILADDIKTFADYAEYKMKSEPAPTFSEGEIVWFDDEKCRVMNDNGSDKVLLMDNTFHTFEAERSGIKKIA